MKRVREDWKTLRSSLGMDAAKTHLLDTEKIKKIEQGYLVFNKSREPEARYPNYELAHHFIKEHVAEILKGKLSLNEEEEKLVKDALGRVYYNPPAVEFENQVRASEKLAELGDRGKQIFSAIVDEYRHLQGEIEHRGLKSDIFFNSRFALRGANLKQHIAYLKFLSGSSGQNKL